jgi:predicted dehydrogenase
MRKKYLDKRPGKDHVRRRDVLLGLGAIPMIATTRFEKTVSRIVAGKPNKRMSDRLRLGIIGFGFRGEQLARSLKFAHPDWMLDQKSAAEKGVRNIALEEYDRLDDLNVDLAAVCDVFEINLTRGIEAGGSTTKGYNQYLDLLADKSIDGVIIASPDHWHARMAMDAAKAGKHVYLEKCMTRTAEEAVMLRDVIREQGIVFQLGHQGRQRDENHKAHQIIEQGTLGKISLVETTTNRNNNFGAWLWPLHEKGNRRTINWESFEGPAPNKVPFNLERFFRWRCWYDYGTGMAGDLLTHEYDALNSILDLDIPDSAFASGGIYNYDDGRDVPDVFHANYEYFDKKLSLIYSGTLANGTPRGTLIMGSDATLELGKSLTVWADSDSVKYKNRIESGIIDPDKPIINYNTENLEIDALTSATSKYFADRGLMYTYQGGKRYDTTNLHLAEWLDCIRNGGTTSCNIEQGFQEAITAHMATISYREEKKAYWDSENEKIVID